MQLLEARIREAARNLLPAAPPSSSSSSSFSSTSIGADGAAEGGGEESLYHARLAEYQELAARYDADPRFRDTVEVRTAQQCADEARSGQMP